MKIIIIEDGVYSVKDSEYKQLKERQDVVENGLKYHDRAYGEMDLQFYIEKRQKAWKFLGRVSFHFQL